MPSNKEKHSTRKSDQLFGQFTRFITNEVVDKHGSSYMTAEKIGNKWRSEIPYSDEVEHFLISTSKLFLRTLDTTDPDCTNPKFLESIIKSMADYLSKYTMRALIPANSKDCDIKKARKSAEKFLFEALYTNNRYIKNLLEKKQVKKKLESQPREISKQRKRTRIKAIKEAKQIANQVQIVFIEVNQYRKK